jgi:hypothetical protein
MHIFRDQINYIGVVIKCDYELEFEEIALCHIKVTQRNIPKPLLAHLEAR